MLYHRFVHCSFHGLPRKYRSIGVPWNSGNEWSCMERHSPHLLHMEREAVMKNLVIIGLLVALISTGAQAALINSVSMVPSGGGTFGHNYGTLEGYPDDFSDSYAYFGPIHADGNLYGTGGQAGYGWVVYKFTAADEETITNVALDVTTYCSTGDIDIFWTDQSYDGTTAPDISTWVDTEFYHRSWGSWVKTETWGITMEFAPESNEFFVAYRMKPGAADYQAQLSADRVAITTIPEPLTLCLLVTGGAILSCRRRSRSAAL